VLEQSAMTPDDLTRPLQKRSNNRRPREIALPVVVGLAGVLSGAAILFIAHPDRGQPVASAPAPPSAVADPVPQTTAIAATAPAMPTQPPPAKTITLTVIDSQTGAKREIILPAPTADQSEQGEIASRSTAAITPTGLAGGRGTAKSKRH
jgi:cytoskeletal protein RodZ